MIAWLGMYDMPPLQAANNRLWRATRAALGRGPVALTRNADPWDIWRSPALLLAQTCGMPFRTSLHGTVRLVGTPDYGVPGCPRGYYCSVLIARADSDGTDERDFDRGVFAYNEALSQSGWAGPMTHLSALGTGFSRVLATGSHAASARAVAQGVADMAGIDAVTWDLLCAHDPVTERLRIVGRTAPTPGLPYITAKTRDPAPIAAALRRAISDLDGRTRETLRLKGLIDIPETAYLSVPTPPAP